MKKEVREVLSVKQEFTSLCADPSLLVGLKDSLSSLETKWSSLRDAFSLKLPEGEGMAELDLSGEDGCRLTSPASVSLNSSSGEEGLVLQEFRAAFQEISLWLDKAEQQLEKTRRPSEDRQLEEQILSLHPKVESLGAMAVRIVDKFTSQRLDVEPEMEILSQRWESVLTKIETASKLSEVQSEQIRTTIAQLIVPLPNPVTTSASSEPEEISTLPEEISTLPEEISTLPEDSNEERRGDFNERDSSRDSSPEFFSASPRTPERNGHDSKDNVFTESPSKTAKKTPPPTKPKPKWYIESLQETASVPSTCSPISSSSVPPVQHVTVTSSTLPSPRSLSSGATVIEPQRKTTPVPIISPVRTILPSIDTSPSTSPVNSPITAAPQSILDDIDKQNERDNAIIDRLLRGTSADIEDVKARKKYTSPRFQIGRDHGANHLQDIKDFEEKFTNISLKIATARQRFQELDQETDYALRNDLIDMELQELEAEVATTISRGDTLVLMVHRFDAAQGEDLQDRVAQLRTTWANLRATAEQKKNESSKESENLELLKEKLEKMHSGLNSVLKVIRQKKTEDEKLISARKEIERRAHEMKTIEKLASSFKNLDKLGNLKDTLISVRSSWGLLKDLGTPLQRSKSRSPREVVDKSVPAEIFTRVTKMKEALSAVRSQLETSIMTGKKYENMELQSEMLDKVRRALDTLRPKVKKTMSDIDVVSGALSMEYFDKLTAQGERLRQEWKEINEDFSVRESIWRECEGELESFNTQADTLSSWLSTKEETLLTFKQVQCTFFLRIL